MMGAPIRPPRLERPPLIESIRPMADAVKRGASYAWGKSVATVLGGVAALVTAVFAGVASLKPPEEPPPPPPAATMDRALRAQLDTISARQLCILHRQTELAKLIAAVNDRRPGPNWPQDQEDFQPTRKQEVRIPGGETVLLVPLEIRTDNVWRNCEEIEIR